MSTGMILLTVVSILVFFGVAQRVLDRLYLTDRSALFLLALMFLGTLIPNIDLGSISVSIGGAVIPAGICIYLLVRSDSRKEKIRTLVGSLLTGGSVYLLSAVLPDEPEAFLIEPMLLYGISGGVIAYILGRSRRGAFVCGVLGVLLADTAVAAVNWANGIQQRFFLGGAGVFDAAIISGILGVLLAELVGEVTERITRGSHQRAESAVKQPIRQKEK